MASELLLTLLVRANLVAAAAILVVLALRLAVSRRFGAQAAYLLWSLVPLTVAASLLPARRVELLVSPALTPAGRLAATLQEGATSLATRALLPQVDLAGLALLAWAIGAAGWLIALAASQAAFHRSLGRLRRDGDTFRSEATGISPALVGVFRPRVILPADFETRFSAEERRIVLAHERAHLRGGDHLVNAVAAVAQCAAWFNPLVHLAVHHLRVDQELACDAIVVERHPDDRRRYAETMLKAQVSPTVAPLACHWPAHPLRRRIAMLQTAPAGPARRAAGLAVVAALGLGGGAAAWASQPPQVDVRVRPARGSDEGWRTERRAETRVAALDSKSHLMVSADRRLDRDLVYAVIEGDADAAQALIKAGANVNAKLIGDGNPLIVA